MKRCVVVIVLMASTMSAHAQDAGALKAMLKRVAALPMEQMAQQVIAPNAAAADTLTDEAYAALEAEFFRRMNWTQTEIDWFRNVYTPAYGDPRGYVQAQMALFNVLSQEQDQ